MPYKIQKHLPVRHASGNVMLNKKMLADLSDLVRTSPVAFRTLMLLMTYANNDNSVITDIKSISKMLGIRLDLAKYAVRKLLANGYITMTEVKLNHKHSIIGVQHDKAEYRRSQKKKWEVIGTKLITDFTLTGTYNRFIIDSHIIKCVNSDYSNNVLTNISGNLFYDNTIPDNEIIWEL